MRRENGRINYGKGGPIAMNENKYKHMALAFSISVPDSIIADGRAYYVSVSGAGDFRCSAEWVYRDFLTFGTL